MHSQWSHLKGRAIQMRKRGRSIRFIESTLNIPRSTLSGWLKNVPLTNEQRHKLNADWLKSLAKSRIKAKKWHHHKKEERLREAARSAESTLSAIPINTDILELAVAFLYLGEGTKGKCTALANSNPNVIKFYVRALKQLYKLADHDLVVELHLRHDQNGNEMITYWSSAVSLPPTSFIKPVFDRRTESKPTRKGYNGVCVIRCRTVAIQRKLMYIASGFSNKIVSMGD